MFSFMQQKNDLFSVLLNVYFTFSTKEFFGDGDTSEPRIFRR